VRWLNLRCSLVVMRSSSAWWPRWRPSAQLCPSDESLPVVTAAPLWPVVHCRDLRRTGWNRPPSCTGQATPRIAPTTFKAFLHGLLSGPWNCAISFRHRQRARGDTGSAPAACRSIGAGHPHGCQSSSTPADSGQGVCPNCRAPSCCRGDADCKTTDDQLTRVSRDAYCMKQGLLLIVFSAASPQTRHVGRALIRLLVHGRIRSCLASCDRTEAAHRGWFIAARGYATNLRNCP